MADPLRLLIVENLPGVAELCECEVRKTFPGARFLRVETRMDFLAALDSFRPDVILSGDQPSGFDGITTLSLALKHGPGIPFILVTGSMHEEWAVACMKAGAWDYILKDHHLKRLGPAIKATLEQRELRRAQLYSDEKLRESEERYRSLFENNHAVMLLVEPGSGGIVDANPAAVNFYGWSREDLCKKNMFEINTLPEHEIRRDITKARQALCNHFQFQHRLANGMVRDVEVYSGPIMAGGLLLLFSIVYDITERRSAEIGLRLSQFCIDHAAIGIFRIDEQGKILDANICACASLGYTKAELCNLSVFDIDAKYTPELWREHRKVVRTKGSGTIESLHRRKDGSVFPVEVTVNYFYYEEQAVSFSFVVDITDRKQAESKMLRLSQAVEQNPAAIVLTDPTGNIEYVNPKFTQITGYSFDEVYGKNPRLLKSGKTTNEEYRELWTAIKAGKEWRGEFYNRRKDGSFFWERALITSVRDPDDSIMHFLAIKEDISERKEYEDRMQHLATHDQLTGLPNRALMYDRLEQSIYFAKRSQRLVAVIWLDLDRFKIINDSLGHASGDELLRQFAQRLNKSVREADTVARLGGDEFVVLLAEIAEESDVHMVAKKILSTMSEPYVLNAREITLSASLGVSLYPRDGIDGETLLRNADIAMYRAKEEGDTFCFYAPEMNIRIHEVLELESDLRRALDRNELSLHFQPKVEIASGQIVGAEALLRWQHPLRGSISPTRFIPIAEETGLIYPIGEWVLTNICKQIKIWQNQGISVVPLAINLSAKQFRSSDLLKSVQNAIEENAINPCLLELELTESMIMRDPQNAVNTMQQLKALGLKLSLDDFGTGYSSLNYLRRFPVDQLKIDCSFICDVATDTSAAAVTNSIVAIAHTLGLKAVAEGVETIEQFNFLRACKCDSFQGYYFSKPVPKEEFATLLREGRKLIN